MTVEAQIAALWNRGPRPFRAWLEQEKAKGVQVVGWLTEDGTCEDPLARYAIATLGLSSEHFVDCYRESWWYSRPGGPAPQESPLPLWAAAFMDVISDDYLHHEDDHHGFTPTQALRFLGQAVNRPSVREEQRRLAELEPLLPLGLSKRERPWRVPA